MTQTDSNFMAAQPTRDTGLLANRRPRPIRTGHECERGFGEDVIFVLMDDGTTSTPKRDAALRALNDCHRFPCPFMFKVIGENTPDFVARVVQAAVMVLGPNVYPEVRTRESAKGKHQSVTMVVDVETAEGVLDVYAALQGLAGVRFLL